ncbi:dihydrofolate reductase family protein [Sphingomonas canadensis]|uniref:Dihydrofolate reductase family protein n=1 Tax=Sphingomonas canadensis TaxID=1219257 RepID=A0ABW3H7C5_9SPHN|nr:dihydrofolate reductase family protein [Sphingomonas canadensis]MCW3836634.1 dihydrofolate reductase family protein [Sphingomonas canadensis]
MRRIIGAAFVSIDGVMQAPGGPDEDRTGGFAHGGWVFAAGDEAVDETVATLFQRPFDLLLGRRTWEIFAAYWPYQSDDYWITPAFRNCRKYALSHGALPGEWEGSERLPDLDALAAVKAGEGPDLVIQGSATLYPQLLARGMIDRLILTTAPLLLGTGKRLFGAGTPAGAWKLAEHRLGSGGCSVTTLEPDGPVKPGSFVQSDPSPAEIARRERWAREG